MKPSLALLICLVVAGVSSAPAPDANPDPQPNPIDDNRPEIIEIIAPAGSAQETLSSLNLGSPSSELGDRNKRTIGILRQLFPQLTQIIEQKVQQLTGMILQTFGPVVLRAFLGNGKGATGGGDGGKGSGTIELDDDEEIERSDKGGATETSKDESKEQTVATKETAKDEKITQTAVLGGEEEDTKQISVTKRAAKEKKRKRDVRGIYAEKFKNVAADENQLLTGAESQQAEVRVAFGENQEAQPAEGAEAKAASDDQQTAAQTNKASIDEISLDDADETEENRNKRFLPFGGQGGSSGSGGGSGNFLFDIVRGPAEAMARAAGTAFRIFAGTDSLNLGLTATHSGTYDQNLVAGSSSGSGDTTASEGEGETDAAKGDNLTEGVPGPITRLFIIANRGIANLIQDLILRLAQTSERIVNFKARLITSII